MRDVFYTLKLYLGCEVHSSEGLQINLDHLGAFNMHRNLVYPDAFVFHLHRKNELCC